MKGELRGAALLIGLVVVAAFVGRCTAPDNATALLAKIADSVATAERAKADSVERVRKATAERDSIAAAAALAHVNQQRDSVIRASKLAQASAATAALNARQLAALDSATTAQLRAGLISIADQVDTLNATIERERVNATQSLAKQAQVYDTRIQQLHDGYAQSKRQDSIADAAGKKAFERGIQLARNEGVKAGRMEGAGTVLALVVLGVVVAVAK